MSSDTTPTYGDTLPATDSGDRLPAVDARYALRGRIGRGGMGEVWAAHDQRLDRELAIKVLRTGTDDPHATARFLREARVQSRLEHPNVVPIHDLGSGDALFLAMRRLSGTTLAEVLTARRAGDPAALALWPTRLLLARLVDVCLAVEFAHRERIVHRDLKPANVMLGDFGEAYVLDWGLAKLLDVDDSVAAASGEMMRGETVPGHTVAGAILGTPGYMAPEQIRGEPVDARTDVFALGCILFELVAGEPAIPREDAFEATLNAPCHRPSVRVPELELPPELDDACARATAARPGDRFPTARALADAIQAYLDGDRDREHRRALAAEHAATAARALAAGARADGMREAGRALALDASNREAQELLARMLLEPPRELPPEARAQIEQERGHQIQLGLRAAAGGYTGFLVLVVAVKLFGTAALWPFVLLGGLLGTLIVIFGVLQRQPRPVTRARYIMILGLHLAALTAAAVIVGPLFAVPIIVVGSVSAVLSNPLVQLPRLTIVLHGLAIVVPLALELLGVLPATFAIEGGAVQWRPWAIELAPELAIAIILAVTLFQVVVTSRIALAHRVTHERTQERLHLQRWHLAQLVAPGEAPAPASSRAD